MHKTATAMLAALAAGGEALAAPLPHHPPLGYASSNEKPVPEWKQKQRALAKVPRGRVMHNHSIAIFREKTGVTAITKRMINGSFERSGE